MKLGRVFERRSGLFHTGSCRNGFYDPLSGERNWLYSAPKECHDFFFGRMDVAHVHEVFGKNIITVPDQQQEDMPIIQSREYYSSVLRKVIQVRVEIIGVFGPVHRWVDVMADVVTVIPTFMIELYIDAGDAVLEVVPRFIRTNKGVLRPIACHGH